MFKKRLTYLSPPTYHYNMNMNGVDLGDQMHSYYVFQRICKRGPFPAITFSFDLEVALTNSYLLQRQAPFGILMADNSHKGFRQYLIEQI